MPSPSSMTRRSSRAQRSVTEFGSPDHVALKASGLYQTTTVQDRIKQWQAHGAASAPAPDAVSVRSIPCSFVSASTETERSVQPRKDEQQGVVDETKHRRVWTTAEQLEASGRMRSSSTPRKRVVSDEHWKAKRNLEHDVSYKQPARKHAEKENVAPNIEPKKDRPERSIKQAKMEREERRRRRVESRSRKVQTEDNSTNDATKAWARSVSSPYVDVDDTSATQRAGSDTQDGYTHALAQRSPSDSNSVVRVEDDYEEPVRKSRYAETLGRPPPTYQDAQLTSKKGGFRNRTKEVLGLADPVPVYSNQLPSIEAWLDDQPDPFVDRETPRVRFKDEVDNLTKPQHAQQRTSGSHRRRSEKDLDLADNGSKDTESNIHKNPDLKGSTDVEEIDQLQSPSLKRSGARTARKRNHSSQQTTSEADPESPIAAAQDQSQLSFHHDEIPMRAVPTRLSTIASVETFQEHLQHDEVYRNDEPELMDRKVTTHEEMMSVLSRPSVRRSTRRKRGIKEREIQPQVDSTKQILDSLAEDETKYSRELVTLVDGVIPVLLQCILSKSDAVAAAEFFTTSTNNESSFSRPVIDMGVALERLKSLHNRFPTQNVDSLLSWCRTAHKAYSDYLKAWRLTLQDVVVNLAPLEGADGDNTDLMARDANGDIVNSDGETVDIAYLMKRPLVNIRRLGRALSCLEEELPDHPAIAKVAEDYRELTAAAKTKHQQEKGRLEDEAAANIDATKCRDIRTMAPLPGVTIEGKRRVRARDCFDMTLFHSTGQRLDCKVELILRDNQQPAPEGGDLLICQIEENGKWLLFASIDLIFVSARKEEGAGNLVLMIRGRAGMGGEWHELIALKTDDLQAVSEWLIMLGSNPLPPKLNIAPVVDEGRVESPPKGPPKPAGLTKAALQRIPSIESVDIPIGEPSVLGVVEAKEHANEDVVTPHVQAKSVAQLNMGGALQKKQIPDHWQNLNSNIARKPLPHPVSSNNKSTISGSSTESVSTVTPTAIAPPSPPVHTQTKHDGRSKSLPEQPQKSRYEPQQIPLSKQDPTRTEPATTSKREATKHSAEKLPAANKIDHDRKAPRPQTVSKPVQQPSVEPVVSVVTPPTTADGSLPKIGKVRGNSSSSIPLTDSIRETWSALSGFGRKAVSQPTSPVAVKASDPSVQSLRPLSVQEQRRSEPIAMTNKKNVESTSPPPPPKHKELPVLVPRSRNIPTLGPSEAQIKMDKQRGRLSTSPLRKEYRPSSASGSENSDSESPYTSDDDSQTSEELAADQYSKSLPKPSAMSHQARQSSYGPPPSVPTTSGTRTLAPSDSASQGPYRRVPSSADRPDTIKKHAIAMICSWNDKGTWEPLVEDFCRIIVSPGLMEAFAIDEVTSQPLAAFELTPMVPLRKPTGLDISIRSPSTPDSRIKTSSNIMFRSRNVIDCEAFYHMINWARFNNPTYNKLARDRPQPQPEVTFSNQQPPPRPRSWFSFSGGLRRRNSYRVGNIPPSSMGESQATANTTSSAMSALRRLTKSSNFNVNRSSVIRRPGRTTNESLYSSSNGTGINSQKSTPPPSQMGFVPGKDGPNVPPTSDAALRGGGMVHNMKIRLQLRHTYGWVTMGFSRLTILPAVKHGGESPEMSRPESSDSNTGDHEAPSRRVSTVGAASSQPRQPRLSSSAYTPHRLHGGGREKRVVVTSEKDPSQVLLDATLGESCFEKISHLGIAVQVWRAEDEIRSRGGVGLGQNTMYLFQFSNAKECAWVFDLVGRYRYSTVITS